MFATGAHEGVIPRQIEGARGVRRGAREGRSKLPCGMARNVGVVTKAKRARPAIGACHYLLRSKALCCPRCYTNSCIYYCCLRNCELTQTHYSRGVSITMGVRTSKLDYRARADVLL